MSVPKVYHLARKYASYSSPFKQDGVGAVREHSRHGHSSSERIINIFQNNEEIRIRKLQLSKEKEYDILGLRQLAIYNRIKDRKKRDLRSNRQEYSFGTYFSARTSRLPSEPHYLTRDQVIKLHSQDKTTHQFNQSTHAEYLSSHLTSYQQDHLTSIVNHSEIGSRKPCQRQKFSFAKLKLKMAEYKKTWQKYTHRKDNYCNKPFILKKHKRFPRDPTLQSLNKSRNSSRDSKTDYVPWSETLRSNNEGNSRGLELEVIQINGFISTGKNKLQKQTQWVNQKHKQGYFFVRDIASNIQNKC